MEQEEAIIKKLAAIERAIQQLPEVMAAVLITMWDEYQSAKLYGKKPGDLWQLMLSPNSPQSRSVCEEAPDSAAE